MRPRGCFRRICERSGVAAERRQLRTMFFKTVAVRKNLSPESRSGRPLIFSRETRPNLAFMIEAKFFPADGAELRPEQPVDVELR